MWLWQNELMLRGQADEWWPRWGTRASLWLLPAGHQRCDGNCEGDVPVVPSEKGLAPAPGGALVRGPRVPEWRPQKQRLPESRDPCSDHIPPQRRDPRSDRIPPPREETPAVTIFPPGAETPAVTVFPPPQNRDPRSHHVPPSRDPCRHRVPPTCGRLSGGFSGGQAPWEIFTASLRVMAVRLAQDFHGVELLGRGVVAVRWQMGGIWKVK